ncbi:MAG: alternative oxidase [Acidimicrobiia bacterium]
MQPTTVAGAPRANDDVGRARPPSEQLATEHAATLAARRRRYAPAARLLFRSLDALYGRERSLRKFKVLEIVARVPYQAWEQVAYIALTHRHRDEGFARRVFDRVTEARTQQDNEQWHLLILQELLDERGERERLALDKVVPQVLAFAYYQLSWLLYVIRPSLSYRLNADFEDHAEHEYAEFVRDNPDLEQVPYDGVFAAEYGRFASRGDLFRQIGLDERLHKQESLARAEQARFT